MKIDESAINHNVLRIIGNVTDRVSDYDFTDDDVSEVKNFSYATLNYICGVFDMSNAMNEVLRTK